MSYSDATSHTVISPGSTVISDGNPEQNLEGFEFDNFTPHQGINEPQQQNNNKHRQVLTEVSPSVLKKKPCKIFTERLLKVILDLTLRWGRINHLIKTHLK